MSRPPIPILMRFYKHVDVSHPSRCWPWLAGKNHAGYGLVKHQGRTQTAHRVSYELWHGEMPPSDRHLMHSCDRRECVNPYHLSIGSPGDNIRDKHTKGRAAPQQGTANHAGAKLTDAQVSEIQRRIASGEVQHVIAADYGITQTLVSRIKRGVRRPTEFGVLG